MSNIILLIVTFSAGSILGFILCSLIVINRDNRNEHYIEKMKFINIDKLDATVDEQCRKCIDELCEFISGVNVNNKDNIIEEFYDVIQAMLGVIKLLGIQHMLKSGLTKHNKKLKDRGWEFSEIE